MTSSRGCSHVRAWRPTSRWSRNFPPDTTLPRHTGITLRSHVAALGADVATALSQTGLVVAFLAHHAWLMADAVGRTLFRLVVTQRRLLEWITAAQSKSSLRAGWIGLYVQMAGSVAIGAAAGFFVVYFGSAAAPVAAPFILAWLFAPAIAGWVSLSPADAGSLPV